MVVPLWRCPILKPLSAKLPPKSETAPHPGWQDGTILGPGVSVRGNPIASRNKDLMRAQIAGYIPVHANESGIVTSI